VNKREVPPNKKKKGQTSKGDVDAKAKSVEAPMPSIIPDESNWIVRTSSTHTRVKRKSTRHKRRRGGETQEEERRRDTRGGEEERRRDTRGGEKERHKRRRRGERETR
jgi:hypothetical protein